MPWQFLRMVAEAERFPRHSIVQYSLARRTLYSTVLYCTLLPGTKLCLGSSWGEMAAASTEVPPSTVKPKVYPSPTARGPLTKHVLLQERH